jgi:hypothetical protein
VISPSCRWAGISNRKSLTVIVYSAASAFARFFETFFVSFAEKLGKEAACPLGQATSHSFYPQGVWASVKQQSC